MLSCPFSRNLASKTKGGSWSEGVYVLEPDPRFSMSGGLRALWRLRVWPEVPGNVPISCVYILRNLCKNFEAIGTLSSKLSNFYERWRHSILSQDRLTSSKEGEVLPDVENFKILKIPNWDLWVSYSFKNDNYGISKSVISSLTRFWCRRVHFAIFKILKFSTSEALLLLCH